MQSNELRNSELYQLIKAGRYMRIPKGQVFQSTDHRELISLIHKGYVKRYSITKDGNQSIQIIHGPGGLLALTLVFRTLFKQSLYEGPEIFYYETMTDTELYSIDSETLMSKVHADPMLYADLLKVCGTRLAFLIHSMENMSVHNAYSRIAHQLVFYCREFGVKTSAGVKILLPLTQQDMAGALNITRETVTTNLKELREKKLINTTQKTIIVPNLKKLEKEAHSE